LRTIGHPESGRHYYYRPKPRDGGEPVALTIETVRRHLAGELITPQEECVIEFESPRGNKMRIQWKASTPHDWVSLLRAWREAEG
jgi:hypothetical protein